MSTGSLAVVEELEVLVWPLDSDSPEKAEGCESDAAGQRRVVQIPKLARTSMLPVGTTRGL